MRSFYNKVCGLGEVYILKSQIQPAQLFLFSGPLYVMVVGFAMVMIGVPLLQAILDFAVVSTRHNQKRIEEEYDILDFIHTRLKFWTKNY